MRCHHLFLLFSVALYIIVYVVWPMLLQVGGLGDVVTSLSRAVQDLGHNVEVILPKHGCLNLNNVS